MDITFEDVAHVIQDARYQQAILDTTPRPDKKIPVMGRAFNAASFLEKQNIDCETLMGEPLGRWFLEKFADLEERIDELEGGKEHEQGTREETRFMKFVEAVDGLRRQRTDSKVSYVDSLRVLKEHKLDSLSIVLSFLAEAKHEQESGLINEAIRASYTTFFEGEGDTHGEDCPVDDSFAQGSAEEDNIESPAETRPAASESDVYIETDETQKEGMLRDRIYSTTGDGVDVSDVEKSIDYVPAALVRAHSEEVSSILAGGQVDPHNKDGEDGDAGALNAALQLMMNTLCTPIYERLLENRYALNQYCRFKIYAHQAIGDKQIRYHRVLGQGAFGTVHGCIVAQTGTMLAMKIMLKKKIKLKRSKSQVVAERYALEALAVNPSPYVMRLRYAYQTKEAFHLVLPLAIGGDLKFHLRAGPFEENRAKFYAAEIAAGLGHIHSLGFIMRDLKPRNILLDSDGHCQISDFGLAASIKDGRLIKGRAGTDGYWSPEVINNVPYGIDADWWSYGCTLFELLTGCNPFSSKHTGLGTRNEGTRRAQIKYPKHVRITAKVLIGALLNRNVESRLGCQGQGVEEVLNNKFSFWKGLDLNQIRLGNHPVPWVPQKGVIYAASQSEMLEHEDEVNGAAMRKIKITPEDMAAFDDFVDLEGHMLDIVKILPVNVDLERLAEETW
eukprot:CAMPEP_0203763258 /NCGR_PEP_ID=MMETSP0098-20131031/15930_1 /ASSEMBLY_ACC=CAM_ASM_000208 /TAXON_ID=96639 /ORGANISM=" , Strain NY0313808BC1" /LENGTH=671 /DNA_ID=CAMNT_0050657905 /DNA_START=271 /DNA_END=2283 /DNA_ORIENTATION=-